MTRTTNRCSLENLLPYTVRRNLVNINAIAALVRARPAEHSINLDIGAFYAIEPKTYNEFYSAADRKARDAIIEKVKRDVRGS